MSTPNHSVIILTAPSGAGKSSIANYLIKQFTNLAFSVSATTRAPRGIEKDGIAYHFISLAKFEGYIYRNEFLEYEMVYQDVYYGTLKSELNRIWGLGKIPILDIDVKGAIKVQKELGTKCLSIFIMPPSIEVLKERLENRKTETQESIDKRISKAAFEISFSASFDVIIKNEVLELACLETEKVINHFLNKG